MPLPLVAGYHLDLCTEGIDVGHDNLDVGHSLEIDCSGDRILGDASENERASTDGGKAEAPSPSKLPSSPNPSDNECASDDDLLWSMLDEQIENEIQAGIDAEATKQMAREHGDKPDCSLPRNTISKARRTRPGTERVLSPHNRTRVSRGPSPGKRLTLRLPARASSLETVNAMLWSHR